MTKSSDTKLGNKTVKNRPVRKRLAQKGPLYAPGRTGYRQRWVNVVRNNVEDMLRLGYDIVVENKKDGIGLHEYEGAHSLGSAVTRIVDREGMKAILMETPLELFEQGRAEKAAAVDEIEEFMKPDQADDVRRNISIKQKNIK